MSGLNGKRLPDSVPPSFTARNRVEKLEQCKPHSDKVIEVSKPERFEANTQKGSAPFAADCAAERKDMIMMMAGRLLASALLSPFQFS